MMDGKKAEVLTTIFLEKPKKKKLQPEKVEF